MIRKAAFLAGTEKVSAVLREDGSRAYLDLKRLVRPYVYDNEAYISFLK